MLENFDTIAAPATPPGRGGVSIVRVSGPLVKLIAEQMLGKIPQPRLATCAAFLDPSGNILDKGIALFFPAPHSFTGEDVLELHGHGGPAVVNSLLRVIVELGARLANPGEFSERAFLNNKIDLIQAEAIADLINASSEQAARSALRSLQGDFSKKIQTLVEAVIELRMYVEAAIDFAEEEIDFLANPQVMEKLNSIIQELEITQACAKQGSLLRDGITVVIAGAPNVGKSSLLNCLSGREVAIVTELAGTTRDLLHDHLVIDGMPLHIMDTAGLRKSKNVVELEGMRRASVEMQRADLVLWVTDARDRLEEGKLPVLIEEIMTDAPVVLIRNKIDLLREAARIETQNNQTIVSLSAKNGEGIDLLKDHIKSCAGYQTNEGVFSARQRHIDALARAKTFLHNGQLQLHQNNAGELLAEDLRQAQLALNQITGEFTSDDLLGRIFSSFCVGK